MFEVNAARWGVTARCWSAEFVFAASWFYPAVLCAHRGRIVYRTEEVNSTSINPPSALARGLPFFHWTARFDCAPSVLLYPVVHQQVQRWSCVKDKGSSMPEPGSAPSLTARLL